MEAEQTAAVAKVGEFTESQIKIIRHRLARRRA